MRIEIQQWVQHGLAAVGAEGAHRYSRLMLTALVMSTVLHGVPASLHLVEPALLIFRETVSAPAQTPLTPSERAAQLAALDTQLAKIPQGWPAGNRVAATVSFVVAGALVILGLALVLPSVGGSSLAVAIVAIAGMTALGVAVIPLIIGIVTAVTGARDAASNETKRQALLREREAIERRPVVPVPPASTPQVQLLGPQPVLSVATF